MMEFFVVHAGSTQVLLFASALSLLWTIEKLVLAQPLSGKLRHTAVNSIFALSALPIEIAFSVACVALASWVATHQFGLLYYLPFHQSPWVAYGVLFVVLDLLDYVYHWTMHMVPAFWRFHLVHHTDPVVDASTTVREHPGETTIRNAVMLLWVLLTGASFGVLILRQTCQTLCTILAHSSLRLPMGPARWLGLLFITPNLHHVHHHFALPYTNRNYGDVFSIWDRLFGTFATLGAHETVFGLDTHLGAPTNETCRGILAMPFVDNPVAAAKGDAGGAAWSGTDPQGEALTATRTLPNGAWLAEGSV